MPLLSHILRYFNWKGARIMAALFFSILPFSIHIQAQSQLPPAFLTDTLEAKSWAAERQDAWLHLQFPAGNCEKCLRLEREVLITQPFLRLIEEEIVAVRTFSDAHKKQTVALTLHLPDGKTVSLNKHYRKPEVLIADIRKYLE